jgi:hypothetical protein
MDFVFWQENWKIILATTFRTQLNQWVRMIIFRAKTAVAVTPLHVFNINGSVHHE